MSNEQLKDQGAVIGYRPNLKLEKEINSNIKVNSSQSLSLDDLQNSCYSSTISSFIENMPSSILNEITNSISNIEIAIERMSKLFEEDYSDSKYSNISLFLSGIKENTDYYKEFLKYHTNNITGSSIAEIIDTLNYEQIRLKTLSNTLKKLYYGNSNISDDAAKKIDLQYISLISEKESTNDIQQINYLTISNDTKLNKTIKSYLKSLNSSAIDLENCLYNTVSSAEIKSSFVAITLKNIFNNTVQELTDKKALYTSQQDIETMEKTLYNYYNKRKNLKEFYNAIYLLNDEYLNNSLNEFDTEIATAISNFDKTVFGSTTYLKSIQSIEAEKQHLRMLYQTISYKS